VGLCVLAGGGGFAGTGFWEGLRHISEIEHTLKMQLIISTVIMTVVSVFVKFDGP
jgi:hypothetical protein